MRIIRYFRKYSRVSVLIVMSLLLVVFLIGDVVDTYSRRQKSEVDYQVGTSFGQPVHQSDVRAAQLDLDLADSLGINPLRFLRGGHEERRTLAFLLMLEAERMGVRVSREDVARQFQANPQLAAALDQLRQRTGRSLNSIYDGLARTLAPQEALFLLAEAAQGESAPQLERAYRDRQQTADIRLSVLDASPLVQHVSEPTEEQLQAAFEQGRERRTNHTESELLFGYRFPDRVELEYLTVDPAAIEPGVSVSLKEARAYYAEHLDKYRRPVEGPPAEGAEPPQVMARFEEVQSQARADRRRAKAIEEAQALVNQIQQELQRPWLRLPPGESLPADQVVSFEAVRETFSQKYAVVHRKTGLVDGETLGAEPGLGQATATIAGQRIKAAILAFHVAGLAAAQPDDPQPVLRLFEPSPVVIAPRGSDAKTRQPTPYQAYVFRVTRVAPSAPPESLHQVREQVVENVKLALAFDLAGEQARTLAERARQVGLEAAVAEAQELKALLRGPHPPSDTQPATQPAPEIYVKLLEPVKPAKFTRTPEYVQNVGLAPGLNEKVFELAEQGPAAEGEHRVVVVPVATFRKWVVVELIAVNPIYEDDFDAQREQLSRSLTGQSSQQLMRLWFDPENIRRRTGFVAAAQPQP